MAKKQQAELPFYPPAGFNFKVTIDSLGGKNEGSFREVSGLEVKMQTQKVLEGGENRFAHQLPGRPAYSNLVLKRGMLLGSALIGWVNKSLIGFKIEPRTVLIELCDENFSPIASWNVVNAYPVALRIDGLNAVENGVAVETIELAYQYFAFTNRA